MCDATPHHGPRQAPFTAPPAPLAATPPRAATKNAKFTRPDTHRSPRATYKSATHPYSSPARPDRTHCVSISMHTVLDGHTRPPRATSPDVCTSRCAFRHAGRRSPMIHTTLNGRLTPVTHDLFRRLPVPGAFRDVGAPPARSVPPAHTIICGTIPTPNTKNYFTSNTTRRRGLHTPSPLSTPCKIGQLRLSSRADRLRRTSQTCLLASKKTANTPQHRESNIDFPTYVKSVSQGHRAQPAPVSMSM